MFFNLSKLDLIKRFHYMLTMLIVHSIVQKKKQTLLFSDMGPHFVFFIKTAESLVF